MEIIPGILEKEWSQIERKIELVSAFATTLHIDIIDGKFVNNTTFLDPKPFEKYAQKFFLEVHMMVDEPIEYLESFAASGFRRFIGHVEKMSDQAKFIAKGQSLGEVGLALDGPTPLSAITVPFIDLDTVLIYTSERVGFSGPPFVANRLEKVKEIVQQESLPIGIDGGVNDKTMLQARDAGVTRFVTTSFLFKGNPKENYAKLHSLLGKSS